ncbi:MAG: RDD family protein [Erysipelotrichaceae bacterium]
MEKTMSMQVSKQKVNKQPKAIKSNIQNKRFGDRLLAFMCDLVIILTPTAVWLYLLLFTFVGIFPEYILIDYLTIVFKVLIIASILVTNSIICIKMHGQTIGKKMYHFKVVTSNDRSLSPKQIILRETLGKAVPLLALFLLLNFIGIIIFFVIEGLFIYFDSAHRSYFDYICNTKVITVKDTEIENVEIPMSTIEVLPEVLEMAENTIDLHVHSNFSEDGQFNVEELIYKASRMGIKTLSITDRNSVKANFSAMRLAEMYHINYIPGVEIDTDYNGKNISILGYNIDYNYEGFARIEYESLAKEKALSLRRISLFEQATGLKVNVVQLMENNRFQSIQPEKIALQILSNVDYANEPILQPYLVGEKSNQSVKNLVKDFFAEGKECFVKGIYPKFDDVLATIKASGGIAIVAHPLRQLTKDEVLRIILAGCDGVEVFTPINTKAHMNDLLTIARETKAKISAGSNFAREETNKIKLGKTLCPLDGEHLVEKCILIKKK